MAYQIKSMTSEEFDAFIEFECAPHEVENRLSLVHKVLLQEAYRLVGLKGKRSDLILQRDRNTFAIKTRRAEVTMDLSAKKAAGDKSLTENVILALLDGDPDVGSLMDKDLVLDSQIASVDRAIAVQDYRVQALQMMHKSLVTLADSMLTERIHTR